MSWSAPPTAVTGAVITAAFWNTGGRDNLNDLDRRTSPVGASVLTVEATASAAFTDLATAGPAVTVTIGSTGRAMAALYCRQFTTLAGEATLMGLALSGATVSAAADTGSLSFVSPTASGDVRHGNCLLLTGLNAGSTTGTAKYRRTNGSGTFGDRFVSIQPLGS